MRPDRETVRHLRSLIAVAVVAAAEALCQEKEAVAPSEIEDSRPERRIVVSIPDRKLALIEDGRVIKTYPTAVGRADSPTPSGIFTIVQRIPNPTWYAPGKVIGPGKENPLGTRWLGLSRKSYGIHGTNNPRSIGRNASHGCIRMRNRDVEDLFARVAVGDVVELHGERDAELARIFDSAGASGDTTAAGGDTSMTSGGGQ
jgi:lipoprotein-anchoring transpeptidase ErfK/SrfK